MTTGGRDRWDLFCRVVDHYGDIGIGWRLAKQLAADPGRTVRLLVDDLAAFARIEPRIDAARTPQVVDAIVVERIAAQADVADVVVELLGCRLPAGYLAAMATAPPVWVDYEHLSAERWVEDFHGLPSPQPSGQLVKHFFYPGFGPRTGGLLVERGLERRRRDFVAADPAVGVWDGLGVPAPAIGELRLSLFAYSNAPASAFVRALPAGWTIVAPEGVLRGAFDAASVLTVPFTDQDGYDRLLWACDVNFVRGEDSFVRAQAAGRPFVWQIYKQAEDAHLKKLEAFEDLYEADLRAEARAAQRAFWRAWNGVGDIAAATPAWLAALPALRGHADAWRAAVAAQEPLVERLVAFVDARRRRAGLLD